MGGMPSAYGGEWRKRADDGAYERYRENLDKVNWKDDAPIPTASAPISRAPASCSICLKREGCPDECANDSQACKDRLGI
jgi:hypothetical protein